MKIELIVDEKCISKSTYFEIKNRLVDEFSFEEIKITPFNANRHRLRNLGINLLPAWLVNNDVLRINPGDYDGLRKKIKQRI